MDSFRKLRDILRAKGVDNTADVEHDANVQRIDSARNKGQASSDEFESNVTHKDVSPVESDTQD